MGDRYISKFAEHLIIQLHERIINNPFYIRYDRLLLNEEFKNLVQIAVENYIDDIPIYPEDLIRFTEIMLSKHQDKVLRHLTTLKKSHKSIGVLIELCFTIQHIEPICKGN